jgi:predicted dinucleotide-binding enzyme
MRIAIIGSTVQGGKFGHKLSRHGEDITFAGMDPLTGRLNTAVEMADEFFDIRTVSQAAIEAEILFINLTSDQRERFFADHANALYDKIVVDLSNDIGQAEDVLALAGRYSDIIFLKLYGQGKENLLDHLGHGWDQQFFLCGDDSGAKRIVIRLLRQIDCEVEDAGDLSAIQFMDQLEQFWHRVAEQHQSGDHEYSFRLIRRGADAIRSRLFSLT